MLFPATIKTDPFRPRVVVWLIDLGRGCFEEAQGGVGFGAVVVEAGVEAFEGFEVVEPQDGSSQEGEHLAAAGFLARARGVFFPQAGVSPPVVFVFHRPVAANGSGELGGAFLFPPEAGNEAAGLGFEFVAFPLIPFAGHPDELSRSRKEADVPVEIDSGEAAALNSAVVFFPVAHPLVGDASEFVLRELVEGGLVVFEA